MLPFCNVIILRCCNITMQYCNVAMVRIYNVANLQCFNVAILQCCNPGSEIRRIRCFYTNDAKKDSIINDDEKFKLTSIKTTNPLPVAPINFGHKI